MKAFLVSILLVISSFAWAKPAYLNELSVAYPNTNALNTTKCMTCHNNGKALNPFGSDYSKIVRRGNLERTEAFKHLALLDSDQDGKSNLEELLAGTNPGKAETFETTFEIESNSNAFKASDTVSFDGTEWQWSE